MLDAPPLESAREDGGFVCRLRAGDPRALDWVERRCRRRARSRFSREDWIEIREDLVADVRSRLLRALARPEFLLRDPASYLNRVIDTRCADYYRFLGIARRTGGLDAVMNLPGRSRCAERSGERLDARRALASLNRDCRRRLYQKYVLGLSLEEMAEREGVSAQTMRSRLHASRRRARARLSRACGRS